MEGQRREKAAEGHTLLLDDRVLARLSAWLLGRRMTLYRVRAMTPDNIMGLQGIWVPRWTGACKEGPKRHLVSGQLQGPCPNACLVGVGCSYLMVTAPLWVVGWTWLQDTVLNDLWMATEGSRRPLPCGFC